MIHRGGLNAANARKAEAAALQALPTSEILAALPTLDAAYRAQHLSPGGCADLLALSLAIHFAAADGLIKPETI